MAVQEPASQTDKKTAATSQTDNKVSEPASTGDSGPMDPDFTASSESEPEEKEAMDSDDEFEAVQKEIKKMVRCKLMGASNSKTNLIICNYFLFFGFVF